MSERWRASVFENGISVARCYGPTRESVVSEANHYAFMYAQDGGKVRVAVKQLPESPASRRARPTKKDTAHE